MSDTIKTVMKRHRGMFILACLFISLLSVLELCFSILLKDCIDAITQGDKNLLAQTALHSLALIAAFLIVYFLYCLCKNRFMNETMADYRSEIRTRILNQDYVDFQKKPAEEYISILTQGMASFENEYLATTTRTVTLIVKAAGALLIMVYYNVPLTLLSLLICGMFLLITSRYSKKVKTAGKQIQESAARMTGYHQALFENAKDLQISDGRKPEQKAEALDRKYEEDVRFKERLMQNIALIGEINGIASMLGIFLAGGIIAITTGLLNAGEVLIFVQLLNYIEQPITQLPAVKAAQSSALHMMQEVENSLPLPEEGTRLESDLESIQVSHVDFSYPETPVFEDLSLSFEKGKSTLILAPSGTGKSTLIQLLLSLQKPQKGDILYNGNKAEGMTADILFEQIGWMPQGYKLLENESYLENLMAEDGKQESIPWNMGFIKTEEQPVGEYSGGEKEKIYLSRIFLQNKPWMILDEPVKSLDPNEQVQVIKQLLALQKSLIVIMHTDDERILSQFDQVITLKNKNAEIQFNPSVNLSRQAFA